MRFTTVEGGVGGEPKTYPEYSRSVYETAARDLGPAVADLRASHPSRVKATPRVSDTGACAQAAANDCAEGVNAGVRQDRHVLLVDRKQRGGDLDGRKGPCRDIYIAPYRILNQLSG